MYPCYWLNVFPSNSYVDILALNVIIFGGRPIWEVIRFRLYQKGGALMMGLVTF